MAALASPAGGHHLVVLEGHQVGGGRAVLRQKGGAVEAHTGLLVDQVRAKVGREGPLHEQDVLAVEGGRRHLPVGGRVDAGRVDDFTWWYDLVISAMSSIATIFVMSTCWEGTE